jgi:hypothetical protein
MNRRALVLLSAVAALLLAGGCDAYEPVGVERQYVVEAYLEAGSPFPPVRLSRTAPVGETYDFDARAVSGAAVRMRRVDAEEEERIVRYAEDPEQPGVYRPRGPQNFAGGVPTVQPLGRYRLAVEPPAGDGIDTDTLTAETVVPDTFRITETSGDTLTWREDSLAVTVTRSQYPGRSARFVVSTTAREATRENLTPLAARAFDRADTSGVSLEELSVTESPVINEGNYEVGPGGRLTIDVPWLVANFYGPNVIALRALGQNYYDFLRSQQVQQGGSAFSPGAIPNVIERIDGGTGLFGSYAVVRYELEVERPSGGGGGLP